MLMVTWPRERFGVGDEQVLDRAAGLVGKRGRPRDVAAGEQQGEFLAAVTGDEDGILQSDERQGLADGAQAGVAADMAVTVVEQLEMIDIDHHQRQRFLPVGRAFPLVVELHGRSRADWRVR